MDASAEPGGAGTRVRSTRMLSPDGGIRTPFADRTPTRTLAANTMQVASGDATFTLQTQPTPLQQRCFELLGVTPRM